MSYLVEDMSQLFILGVVLIRLMRSELFNKLVGVARGFPVYLDADVILSLACWLCCCTVCAVVPTSLSSASLATSVGKQGRVLRKQLAEMCFFCYFIDCKVEEVVPFGEHWLVMWRSQVVLLCSDSTSFLCH